MWTDSTNWTQWVTQRVKRKRKEERRMGEGEEGEKEEMKLGEQYRGGGRV